MSDDSSKPVAKRPAIVAAVFIFITVAAYLLSTIAGGAVVYLGYVFSHGGTAGISDWLSNSIGGQFGYTLVTYAIFLALVVVAFRALKVSYKQVGLGRLRWSDPLYALSALPVYYISYAIVVGIVSNLVPKFNSNQPQQIGFTGAHGGQLVLVFLSLAVIPPIVEEIITRGYLYTGLKSSLPKYLAVIITSIIFAVGHLEFGSGTALVWVAALFTLILSLVLIALREITGRIYAGMFLHALVNSISFLALFVFHSR